jgi:hypothetical protein
MRNQIGKTMTQMALKTAAVLAAFAYCTNSHAADEVNILLPSPEYAPGQRARDVLVDPFSPGPAPGVFVGLWGGTSPSVLRLTPVDAESSAFHLEEVDRGLESVFRLTYNQNDGIYAGGHSRLQYTRRDSALVWTVRRSARTDEGNQNTWKDDDQFYFQTINKNNSVTVHHSTCLAVAADHTGAMFATGKAYNGSSDRWVIRRKLPGGDWTTVRDVATGNINMNPGLRSFPGNATTPAAVFAVGDEGFRWAVLRSQHGGAANTWVNVDDWPDGPAQSAAVDAAVDPVGNIYVAGYRGVNGTNPSSWTVRRSSDGGTNWITLLDVPGPTVTAAVSLGIDSAGAVTVSGTVTPDGTTPRWMVVRCTEPGSPAAWTAAFAAGIYPFGGTSSRGSGVSADPFGNLFLGGVVRDWTDETNTSYSGARAGLVRIVP